MNYYSEIKTELVNNEILKKVKDYSKNKSDLKTYYNVGKLLSEAGKHYGEGIIKEYSKKLTKEVGKGYSLTRLKYMRRFYDVMSKSPSLTDLLSYTHYCELIWIEDYNEINYYINVCVKQNLSVRQLREKIKNNEYARLPEEAKNKITNQENLNIDDLVKNPVIIKNSKDNKYLSEKMLQQLILQDIPLFLEELGEGFTFIKNEFKIKIGNNYIDLLLFNII